MCYPFVLQLAFCESRTLPLLYFAMMLWNSFGSTDEK
jgi:hypothetical protein